MRLVTFRRGRGEPKPGALWQEHVLDLAGLAKDLAVQRGTVRRGRGGFPRTVLEIVQGSEAVMALTREAWEHGQRLVGQTAAEELAQRRLAYPQKRVRLLAQEARQSGTAAVMVTHDYDVLDHCDRVMTMTDGRLTAG